MDCELVKINLPEYIDGKLDIAAASAVQNHLSGCESCKKLHREYVSFLSFIDSAPAPQAPEGMEEEFARLIAANQIQEKKKRLLFPVWTKVAAAFVFAFLSYWLGYKAGTWKSENIQSQLTSELSVQKQQVLLASLRDYTGPQKIEAVYAISSTENASDELIDALVYTMNSDKNTNVRLAAITALSGLMDKNERVKKEFIKSLTIQENPLLQISLIQVLTEKGVKEAKDQIETITNNEKTDESVKAFAKDMMKTII